MKANALVALGAALFLSGCPGKSSPASPGAPNLELDTAQKILGANASDPRVGAALAGIAAATTRGNALRYLALRRLEEQGSPLAITTSENLALSGASTNDATFMRNNALAVLFRSQTPEGKAAYQRVKTTSAGAAITAAELERSGK